MKANRFEWGNESIGINNNATVIECDIGLQVSSDNRMRRMAAGAADGGLKVTFQ